MPTRYRILTALVAGLALAAPGRSDEGDKKQLEADVKTLTDNKIPTDGPGLATYFRKRTLADDTRARVARLIRQLGADTFREREQAGNDLEELGGLVRLDFAADGLRCSLDVPLDELDRFTSFGGLADARPAGRA